MLVTVGYGAVAVTRQNMKVLQAHEFQKLLPSFNCCRSDSVSGRSWAVKREAGLEFNRASSRSWPLTHRSEFRCISRRVVRSQEVVLINLNVLSVNECLAGSCVTWLWLLSSRYWLDINKGNGFNSIVPGQWFNKMAAFILGTHNDHFVKVCSKKTDEICKLYFFYPLSIIFPKW